MENTTFVIEHCPRCGGTHEVSGDVLDACDRARRAAAEAAAVASARVQAAPGRARGSDSVLFALATLPITVTVICTGFALFLGVLSWVASGGSVIDSVLGWGKTGVIAGVVLGVLADVFYLIGKVTGDSR